VAALPIERAPAKVNLTLRVLRRRPDGYHDLTSLVAFADAADVVTLMPGEAPGLVVTGPTADACGATGDNLVLKAVAALSARVPGLKAGRFILDKQLPVAAGLGGGSADAAAALRLLARANALSADDPRLDEAAGAVGADVPVCLRSVARMMEGVGHDLAAPLALAPLPAVLVNPGVAVATRDVFTALRFDPQAAASGNDEPPPSDPQALLAWLRAGVNDLEKPALALAPAIGEALEALGGQPGVQLARMSGSGATCFGLFADAEAASAAAHALAREHPQWWVRATTLR
jgi:4-diphosphocytidyl-2-C-methyl-D-erythritol kinase